MQIIVLFFFVLSQTSTPVVLGDSVTDGTTLISTFIIHRHGDRTPVETTLSYSTNVEALTAASAPYGYGQLTNLGKQRSYELGKFIRARYAELLSPHYNKSEIYIRSTDSTRAKMTILTALAAVFPADPGSWSEDINWVPTPYTTVPAKYDINMAIINCPVFISRYDSLVAADHSRMSRFKDVLNVISEELGYNITTTPALVYPVHDVYIAQQNLGVSLGDTISSIMPKIREAAGVAIDIVYGDEDTIALLAGPLLSEFFKYTAAQICGAHTPPVRIYSAHEINVYAFMAVAQINPRQGVPKYSSAFALELRKVKKTGKFVVLPVYQPEPGADLIYLPVAGCDSLLCPYDTFKEIVSPYLLDESTWRTKCEFDEDMVIEDSIVA